MVNPDVIRLGDDDITRFKRPVNKPAGELQYIQYEHALEEKYLPAIRALISKDLIGVVICKLEVHASHSPRTFRGYIAMLAVSSEYRGHGIATALVKKAIDAMAKRNADEIVLETEENNFPAMRLYTRLGFLCSKKLHRYYLNGNSAYRLMLILKRQDPEEASDLALDTQ